jgi:hypothetical protein
MRVVLATAVAALAMAAPAGAVSIPKSFSVALAQSAQVADDKGRSCQAGDHTKAVVKSKHPQVVACEQPPRGNLLSPDKVAKATAAALSVLG